MKKTLLHLNFLSALSLSLLFSIFAFTIPIYVNAETHIINQDVQHGGYWVKENSPYILDENIYISGGNMLTINSGVVVISASTTSSNPTPNSLTFDGADLSINGTENDPVNMIGLQTIYFVHSNSNITNAVLGNTGLNLGQSTSTITKSIIKNAEAGVFARGSNVEISKSKILNNSRGIGSYKYFKGPFLVQNDYNMDGYGYGYGYGVGGIGNALEGVASMILDPEQNVISITDSSIVGNTQYGIINQAVNPIFAENNWWGNANGPTTETIVAGDTVSGPISVTPWKDKDPEEVVCCSNVLFLPGIEASRLYKDVRKYFGTSTDQLWEPFGNTDVKKLLLDNNGKSLDDSIYTSDILDSAFNVKNIYESFVAMMNGVVADGVINSWLPFPYDWRMSIEDVVYGMTKLSTTSVSLIDSIEKLSKNSKTGKVVVVAHSNGGLIAKMLVKALEEKGEAGIVEKIVYVAVPELGTPKAILSMLHGYDQSIGKGFLVSEKNARIFSQNMASAYGLLPSRKFFEMNPIKMVSDYFSSSTGLFASTYDTVKNFLLNNSFSKKTSSDTNVPLLLNPAMVDNAEKIHLALDSFKPASTTKTLALIGWGLPTAEGITYKKDEHCSNNNNDNCGISYIPDLTNSGDGTVLSKSNSYMSDMHLFFNLKELDKDTKEEINHANILESSESLNLIKKQISNSDEKNYGKYITTAEPVDSDRWLTIKIFSPVDIDIYDKDGNHTGLLENYDPKKNFDKFESEIPLSYYLEYSDVKLVRLLYGEDYQIVLKGNDSGSFVVKAEVEQFDEVIASTTFGEMPVTPFMNAEMIIPTSTDIFATSSLMNIDVDGDGVIDLVNHSDEFLDRATYLEFIRKTIIAMKLIPMEEQKWLRRIDKISRENGHEYPEKIEKIIKKLSRYKFKREDLKDELKSKLNSELSSELNSKQRKEILKVFKEMLDRLDGFDKQGEQAR